MIDVIVATYNRPEKLQRCISSLEGADKVIIVDDGSDAPVYGLGDKIIPLDHCGLNGKVKDAGIKASKNKWVCCVDDDDWLEPNALGKCASFLQAHPRARAMYTSNIQHFEGTISRRNPNRARATTGPWEMTPLVVIQREAYEEIGGYDLTKEYGVSLEFYSRVWKLNPFYFSECLYHQDLSGKDRIGSRFGAQVAEVRRDLFQR